MGYCVIARKNRDCPRRGLSLFLLLILFFTVSVLAAEDAGQTARFYERVVRMQPGNPNAQFDLGNIYLSEKRYDDALAHYEKVNKTGLAAARMDSYYFNRSVCYAGLGRMSDAVRSLEECLKINPGYQEARDLLEIYKDKSP